MDKKALRSVPAPTLTKAQRQAAARFKDLKYLVTSAVMDGSDTLILNFFRNEYGRLIPEFRTFFGQGDYISQVLKGGEKRWKLEWVTGAVDYLTQTLHWSSGLSAIRMNSQEDRSRIMEWMGRNTKQVIGPGMDGKEDTEVVQAATKYCEEVKASRLAAKYELEKAEIDAQMERFGTLPGDYDSFIRNEVFAEENFFFYSRRKKYAYCTRCGKEYRIGDEGGLFHNNIRLNACFGHDLKHNSWFQCPFCYTWLQLKSDGIVRDGMVFYVWSVLVQKSGRDVLVRYLRHTKDLSGDYRNPEYTTAELFRTVHTSDGSRDYMFGRWKNTDEYRWTHFHVYSGWCWGNTGRHYPKSMVFYEKNYEEALEGTCMQYSCLREFIDRLQGTETTLNSPWAVDKYFHSYRRHPYLEQLIKVKLYTLARDVLKRPEHADALGLRHGRTICESLGIDRIRYRKLLQVENADLDTLKVLRDVGDIPLDDLRHLCLCYKTDRCYQQYLEIMPRASVARIRRYMLRQGIGYERDYFDYIGWIRELGYDMNNEFNLFPKPFWRTHDEKAEEYRRYSSSRAKEEAAMFNEMMKKAREEAGEADPSKLRSCGLFIRPPYELDELKREGEVLHHCVATYAEKVARGETMIFFVRKTEEPEKPYFTLEWKDGRMIQCRGMRNCDMPPEVKMFTDMFARKMHEYESERLDRGRRTG